MATTERFPFLQRSAASWQSALRRYALALVITGLVTLARSALDPVLSDHSVFTFYFASVILGAWYCGFGPAIVNVILAVLLADYLFINPRYTSLVPGLRHQMGLVAFCCISSYLAYLIHWLKRDIARRKQVESDLRVSQQQVQLHQAELAHMSRLSIMGEMAATLAHELNQPLHAAKNYACGCARRLQKLSQGDDEVMEALERIAQESDRAAGIIRRVREFVQKSDPEVSAVSVSDVVRRALLIINLEATRAHTEIACEIPPDLAPVEADPIQIEQVVVNLALNGLESMQEAPEAERMLSIGARQSDEQNVEVFVRDCGKGISEEEMKRIFEPFFTTKPEGMGMGLAISQTIIRAHEGRIWVSANENQGCTFHFTLPVAA